MMATVSALGIICKTPRSGVSKTRLVGPIDPDDVARLSGAFIRDVAAAIEAVPEAVGHKDYAVYAPAGSEDELRQIVPNAFELLLQADTDLGVVLLAATQALLARGHDCAILINADSPTLPVSLPLAAIAALRASGDRVVLGPAIDGGYYLIGLKRAHGLLFEGIPWSTSRVLSRTVERAGALNLPVCLLPEWYDVDDAETFAILEAELAGRPPSFAAPSVIGGPALATRAFMAERAARSRARPAPAVSRI
jgi:uncharacterized protein